MGKGRFLIFGLLMALNLTFFAFNVAGGHHVGAYVNLSAAWVCAGAFLLSEISARDRRRWRQSSQEIVDTAEKVLKEMEVIHGTEVKKLSQENDKLTAELRNLHYEGTEFAEARCPECGKVKQIDNNDYVCNDCRKVLTG